MAAHAPRFKLGLTPDRSRQLAALPAIPAGMALGILAVSVARDWRWTVSHFPHDPTPAASLLTAVMIGAGGMLIGLAMLVSRRTVLGSWLFVPGVALICGVAIGFFAS